jgi:hypothetical protein
VSCPEIAHATSSGRQSISLAAEISSNRPLQGALEVEEGRKPRLGGGGLRSGAFVRASIGLSSASEYLLKRP